MLPGRGSLARCDAGVAARRSLAGRDVREECGTTAGLGIAVRARPHTVQIVPGRRRRGSAARQWRRLATLPAGAEHSIR